LGLHQIWVLKIFVSGDNIHKVTYTHTLQRKKKKKRVPDSEVLWPDCSPFELEYWVRSVAGMGALSCCIIYD
jgi:hypothetical protein